MSKLLAVFSVLCLTFLPSNGATAPGRDDCWVCGKPIFSTSYTWKDEIAGVKRFICEVCVVLPDNCYRCSLPVKTDATDLGDGRYLCQRDVKDVLLDGERIKKVCQDVGPVLDRQFSRYLAFPTNVSFEVVDRLTLVDLFKMPGKDYTCPNVLGYVSPETNAQQQVEYAVRVLSGQTRAATEAVCAHELTHGWLMANVPEERLSELDRDSIEGFCELVAFMLMRDKNETIEMAVQRTNRYTRGQLELFIDAEQRFGFNDVLDWIRHGDTNRLRADEVWRIREVTVARGTTPPSATRTAYASPAAAALPDRLMLKSVSLGGKAPTALINQCTLGLGETGTIRLAGTNLLVQCRAIRSDSVLIELVGSGEIQELKFERKPSQRANATKIASD